VTFRVVAVGPKNSARMSFSMPTTSKPASTKWATDSDPMRPPDPVTIATGIYASAALTARSFSATHAKMSASTRRGARSGCQSVRPRSRPQSEI
jgi:hypothetical protein